MLEKFHEFDRQNNERIIQEGLNEIEDRSNEQEALPVEKSDNLKKEIKSFDETYSDDDKSALFAKLEKPFDILALPNQFRREGLKILKEKIAERYLSIGHIQNALFDQVEKLYAEGHTDPIEIERNVKEKAREYNFQGKDKEVFDNLFDGFIQNYKALNVVKDLSQEELLQRFRRNPDTTWMPQNNYHAKVTPFSVEFSFENVEDFRHFVSRSGGEAKEKFGTTYGLSYYENGTHITAAGYKYWLKETHDHERQHKKFNISSIDTFSVENQGEWDTRNELLASFTEKGDTRSLYDHVLSYRFDEKYGINEAKYQKVLRGAVDTIRLLQGLLLSKEEIISTLSRETLTDWPKVYSRLIEANVGKELYLGRKKKRSSIDEHRRLLGEKSKKNKSA
ncbi:MAG: hypothetical protein WC761_06680 [Candidatus Paceibacterota bacterium]|jgi:hypothetical protein